MNNDQSDFRDTVEKAVAHFAQTTTDEILLRRLFDVAFACGRVVEATAGKDALLKRMAQGGTIG